MTIMYGVIGLFLFSLVFAVGLVGNGLLIFIVVCQKNLRTVPNLLVVSLACGDFLFVLFCVPFGAIAYSLEYYPFSTIYCRFENFIINLSLGVSIFSLLALSADRYSIIAKPFSSHTNDPTIKLKLVVLFIWFLSALLALPETLYSGLISQTIIRSDNTTFVLHYCWSPNETSLLLNHKFMIIRQILRLFIYYLLPFLFIFIFYSVIAKTLFRTINVIYSPRSSQTSSQHDERRSLNKNSSIRNSREIFSYQQATNQDKKTRKQLRARHKLAKIVLFLSLAFFICWLPKQIHDFYWFVGVLVYASPWNHFWQINKTLAMVLTYLYSCINPIALYFLSSTFRHFYKRYLCFWTHTNCCSKVFLSVRRPTRESMSINDYRRRSSAAAGGGGGAIGGGAAGNTITTIYFDVNRIKLPNYS